MRFLPAYLRVIRRLVYRLYLEYLFRPFKQLIQPLNFFLVFALYPLLSFFSLGLWGQSTVLQQDAEEEDEDDSDTSRVHWAVLRLLVLWHWAFIKHKASFGSTSSSTLVLQDKVCRQFGNRWFVTERAFESTDNDLHHPTLYAEGFPLVQLRSFRRDKTYVVELLTYPFLYDEPLGLFKRDLNFNLTPFI
jgi:hypothetical protein